MTHQSVSYAKSGIRILGAILAVVMQSITVGFVLFGIAELLGVLEEVVDKRKEE
jgi:hypothetical protein